MEKVAAYYEGAQQSPVAQHGNRNIPQITKEYLHKKYVKSSR